MLTDEEHEAIKMSAELYNFICQKVIKSGMDNDAKELALHIHNIQHMIMAQSAARLYPDKYRLLGSNLKG